MQRMEVDVWSDIACPWCYVGKRRLDPSAPKFAEPAIPYAERLARKYGSPVAEAERRIAQMTEVAAQDGLDFHFERVRPGNTFDAHRLIHLAHAKGLQDAVKERLLRAYLSEGAAIGDPGTLRALAVEAGLAEDDVVLVLQTDAYAREVREDERAAHEIGVRGVPFFAIGGRYGLSGAQPVEVLLQAIELAWREQAPAPAAEGAVCGPDGCA